MYLKSLEMVGFKSFADKTTLQFEPGMTAIVGPNGCGKSNVADAIRWVLGEQSAKAMRGANMTDVIFNGTDTVKPHGMAEVSMTLANCEQALGLDYNEVTITRRVFRSGEGQYFINKAPCRLKDIQRLFMDTGIGTNSYSLMEQGRIDRILSSRPDDRREVFEEASGITKFKADKKEAIRKLDQTEANLLRLADILREVKRQIISLQRQAGKARRFQELQGQLRSLDLFAARERVTSLDQEIATLQARIASIVEQDEAVRQDLESVEKQNAETRATSAAVEKEINDAMEAAVRARTELERIQETMRHNQERILEMQALSERDTRDATEARSRLDQHQQSLMEQQAEMEKAKAQRETVERDLTTHAQRLNNCEQTLAEANKLIHRLRTEQLESETRVAQLQNELAQLDAEERTNMIRRERLAAEHGELQRTLQLFQERKQDLEARLKDLAEQAAQAQRSREALTGQKSNKTQAIADLKQKIADLRSRMAARQAQVDLLKASQTQREGFSAGARWVLAPTSALPVEREAILGPLAELLRAEPEYQLALEAILRPWTDAVVVRDAQTALALLAEFERNGKGAARFLFPAAGLARGSAPSGDLLQNHVQCAEHIRPLLEDLLHNVAVADHASALSSKIPPHVVTVTRAGAVFRAGGAAEHWQRGDDQSNPLARQQMLDEWSRHINDLRGEVQAAEQALDSLQREETTLAATLADAGHALETARRNLALAEGEAQVITRDAGQAAERVETVAWEIQSLGQQNATSDERRKNIAANTDQQRNRQTEIRAAIAAKTEELREIEQAKAKAQSDVADLRVRFSESRLQVENIATRIERTHAHIQELESLIDERSRGVSTYQARIADLQKSIEDHTNRIKPSEEDLTRHEARLTDARATRAVLSASLASLDEELRQKRNALEDIRARKSQQDIELAQQQMRRTSLIERVTGEYRISAEQISDHPEPAWENGHKPDRDTLETMIAELRTKIEGMGPVNLVAIEEHRELEERLAFLTTQQTDLVNAKQQLMDLIREINKKTTEMFSATFDQVNKNFQEMFSKLFGGGSAKLVLVDEQDVLESGIEIIARPPGKKLQTVSLLSGGERTMTAVALLFALYLVKPSAFCMLDELDAALDEANIGRFVRTVQGFLEKSQFVVITHNRMTISAAQVLYGVTMAQQGISKIVSVKFNNQVAPAPDASTPSEQPTPTTT